jgi:hypothetical protein
MDWRSLDLRSLDWRSLDGLEVVEAGGRLGNDTR